MSNGFSDPIRWHPLWEVIYRCIAGQLSNCEDLIISFPLCLADFLLARSLDGVSVNVVLSPLKMLESLVTLSIVPKALGQDHKYDFLKI